MHSFIPSALQSAHCVPGPVQRWGKSDTFYISPVSCIPSIPSVLTHQHSLSVVIRSWGVGQVTSQLSHGMLLGGARAGQAAASSNPLTRQGHYVPLSRLHFAQAATSKGTPYCGPLSYLKKHFCFYIIALLVPKMSIFSR